ncbi:MAG: cellulose binding domain-containing protein [Terracidiphilus sp.]
MSTPLLIILIFAVSLFIARPAHAGTGTSPDGIYWCLGEDINDGANMPIAWSSADDAYTPPLASTPNPADTHGFDQYMVDLNYWNTWLSTTSLGYSHGVVCTDIALDSTGKPTGTFTLVHAALPSVPRNPTNCNAATADGLTSPGGCNDEDTWATNNPNSFPWYGNNPFHDADTASGFNTSAVSQFYPGITGASTDGGPTAYLRVWKGCDWDSTAGCTAGANFTDNGGNPDGGNPSSFPKQLSAITSLPSTWVINYPPAVGNRNDANQVWDAGYDIWFDVTGDMDTGAANPYGGNTRGQNDGLEIMVWMDHNHTYVDGGKNTGGFAQPSGWPREQVSINNVIYDVWTARLNNPYFGSTAAGTIAGVTNSNVIGGDAEPYKCTTLPGSTCGTEWNVITFAAAKANGTDYRSQSMSMDAKVFTDYIMGIQDGLWSVVNQPSGTRDASGVLLCPLSATYNNPSGQADFAAVQGNTRECLNESWYLTSIQTGFEPWAGGVDYSVSLNNPQTQSPRGLQSTTFQAYDYSTSTTVQSGRTSGNGTPVVYWGDPFNVVYSGCTSFSSSNNASFLITGTSVATGGTVTYPANGTFQNMGAQDPNTLLFTFTVPALQPMHGDTTITFHSGCGNQTVSIFIDPSGAIFYSDSKTPVQGAKVTLLYSPSGSSSGPFQAVPNHNIGLTNAVMQPDDNTTNAMSTDKFGSFAWNVAPGFYVVNAQKTGCGTVSSAVQHVVNTPIINLNLDLPCTAPPPPPGIKVQLTPNGTPWATGYCENVVLTNTSSQAVTWKVNFTLPFPGHIYDAWNFNYTASGNSITATGVGWDNVLQPGQTSNSIGFCATR